jgi:hypothetical protein
MSQLALEALQLVSPIAHSERERGFTRLLPKYLESVDEPLKSET